MGRFTILDFHKYVSVLTLTGSMILVTGLHTSNSYLQTCMMECICRNAGLSLHIVQMNNMLSTAGDSSFIGQCQVHKLKALKLGQCQVHKLKALKLFL